MADQNLRLPWYSGNLIVTMSLSKVAIFFALSLLWCLGASRSFAQRRAANGATGLAWRVQGDWQQNARGPLLLSGDPILPGALLVPVKTDVAHSITLLLPDGQRILYECFTTEDCVRGFRIPPLIEVSSPFAARMLRQISDALVNDRAIAANRHFGDGHDPSPASPAATTSAKRDEALVTLQGNGTVSVTGLLSALANGDYTYNLLPLDHRNADQLHVALKKTSPACVFPVPATGLYDVAIWDSDNTPRINLFLAVIDPSQAKAFSTFPEAKKLLTEWNKNFYGWPVPYLLEAYLESLMASATRH